MIPPDASAGFVAAMEDVLDTYQKPRHPARPLVCLDETSKQLLIETRAPIPAKPGRAVRHDYEYKRNGVANLFMMFAPLEGWYLDGIFAEDLHAKRVKPLANGALGVKTGASLAVSIIGQSQAQARGLLGKHAIKQVDRLLSNQGIVVWDIFPPWVAEVVGERKTIVVAMDWTDFDADDQATLALSLVTNHGRATPLLWLTALKDELKNQRNDFASLTFFKKMIFGHQTRGLTS